MSNETEVIEVRTSAVVHQELARIAAVAGVTLDDVCRVALATWMLRRGERAGSGTGGSEMKPDWIDAPSWANWRAMDSFGKWHWHEKEPHKTTWNDWTSGGRVLEAVNKTSVQWQRSAERRPEAAK